MSYPVDINDLAWKAYQCAENHGFWDGLSRENVEVQLAKLALITSEIGEAVEAVRLKDQKNLGEELADIVIRVFDLSAALSINIQQEIFTKMAKNELRPFKHNKHA